MTEVFTLTYLADRSALVEGALPEQQCIVYADEWLKLKGRKEFEVASKQYDEAVEAFFAPLVAAADAAEAALDAAAAKQDEMFIIVFDEGEAAVPGRPATSVYLNRDSVILRMIESGDTSRLRWVGNTIQILAA